MCLQAPYLVMAGKLSPVITDLLAGGSLDALNLGSLSIGLNFAEACEWKIRTTIAYI